jgi:hypothetical protein
MALERTDKCGNPNPDVCIPQTVQTPICYLTPALYAQGVCCGLPGFKEVTILADCSADSVVITDANHVPVPGAYEVPCASTLGGGDIAYSSCPPPPAASSPS